MPGEKVCLVTNLPSSDIGEKQQTHNTTDPKMMITNFIAC